MNKYFQEGEGDKSFHTESNTTKTIFRREGTEIQKNSLQSTLFIFIYLFIHSFFTEQEWQEQSKVLTVIN
jgi:hypothetical protein